MKGKLSTMGRKYLEDIGYNVNEDDVAPKERRDLWGKQSKEYGFDVRDTWNLDHTMLVLLYERLKMFNEVNIIDTEYHTVSYQGKELTLQQVMDKMIKKAEQVLTNKDYYTDFKEVDTAEQEIWEMWSLSHKLFWW